MLAVSPEIFSALFGCFEDTERGLFKVKRVTSVIVLVTAVFSCVADFIPC
jgi:hypothetical protein